MGGDDVEVDGAKTRALSAGFATPSCLGRHVRATFLGLHGGLLDIHPHIFVARRDAAPSIIMATVAETQPQTPAQDWDAALAAILAFNDKLDRLWERYLDLLDQYQGAQRELQNDLSAVSSRQQPRISLCLTDTSGFLLPRPSQLQVHFPQALWARLLR
jgi:hypothetical protein